MDHNKVRPFTDIAERIKWHRMLQKLNQAEYAEKIGVKRAAFSLWEAGTHRLSLDGALAIRERYQLSLDFLYAGNADALPMALRNEWLEKSA
jgi:transcriptional regulator with XRE-family HTH domain